MTKKDIKYGLLFQNKLSSKPGSHMSVPVMLVIVPLAVWLPILVACCEYKIVSVSPFVAFTITIKGEGAFYFCVVCIFPSSHLYFWQVPF